MKLRHWTSHTNNTRHSHLIQTFVRFFFVVFLYGSLYYLFGSHSARSIIEDPISSLEVSHLIPSDSFDLFWTTWFNAPSRFRGRHFLVLESIFIHHPNATLIILSPTLDDEQLFLPFRQRGYHVYSFDVSPESLLQWRWFIDDQTKKYLKNFDFNDLDAISSIENNVRNIVLCAYGGTFLKIDTVILKALPREEFVLLDRSNQSSSEWAGTSSTEHQSLFFIRSRSSRPIFLEKLLHDFSTQRLNQCDFAAHMTRRFNQYIRHYEKVNQMEPMYLNILEIRRLYPMMPVDPLMISHDVQHDTSLQLADLIQRHYVIRILSSQMNIVRGSLIDLLFDQLNLGDLRRKIPYRDPITSEIRLVHPSVYIHTDFKRGQFIGRDVIYLRLNKTMGHQSVRWNLQVTVSNGTMIFPYQQSFMYLNQAEVNQILHKMVYRPQSWASIDTVTIDLQCQYQSIRASLVILVFSRWVTFITKTMGTDNTWFSLKQLYHSIEKYFPHTQLQIASDAAEPINQSALTSFILTNQKESQDLILHNLPDDSGLSFCRNHLIDHITTPFFFYFDDDFTLEDDSHVDILLELIYTHSKVDIIAGKIPEDFSNYRDYSGVFLLYNQTLEVMGDVPIRRQHQLLFSQSFTVRSDANPCQEVDFVPNAFLGRTNTVRSVRWNDRFKVGEHEDFFLRFRQANRTVWTCRYIHTHHHQRIWWKMKNDTYYEKRTRTQQYFREMLNLYGWKKFIAFDYVHVDLNKAAHK